jgi:hypothetical protein
MIELVECRSEKWRCAFEMRSPSCGGIHLEVRACFVSLKDLVSNRHKTKAPTKFGLVRPSSFPHPRYPRTPSYPLEYQRSSNGHQDSCVLCRLFPKIDLSFVIRLCRAYLWRLPDPRKLPPETRRRTLPYMRFGKMVCSPDKERLSRKEESGEHGLYIMREQNSMTITWIQNKKNRKTRDQAIDQASPRRDY